MALNLHLLRVFNEVAQRRSFTRAAEALFISQPAVSKAVASLEHQLGLPLLERAAAGGPGGSGVGSGVGTGRPAGRELRLTEAGQALHDHARALFALERVALEDVRERIGLRRGELTVGASTTVAGYWLPPVLARFAGLHPDVQLRVVVGNTRTVCDALADCQLDMALIEGDSADPRIQSALWREDPLCVVAMPGSPLASGVPNVDVLSAACWLVREPGSGTREVAARLLAARGVVPDRTREIGSNEAIARAAAAGLGVALLPEACVRDLLTLGELARVDMGAPLSRPLHRLQLQGRPPSPAALAFLGLLDAALPSPANRVAPAAQELHASADS